MKIAEALQLDQRKARIEIIPLIDVIFFLLATFVLFTLSLSKISALDVRLPESTKADPQPDDQTLYVQAVDGGTYHWKEGRVSASEVISEAELAPRLADYRRRALTPRVFVGGSGNAKFGVAVHILDEVRKAGITQASIETTHRGLSKKGVRPIIVDFLLSSSIRAVL